MNKKNGMHNNKSFLWNTYWICIVIVVNFYELPKCYLRVTCSTADDMASLDQWGTRKTGLTTENVSSHKMLL